MLEHRAFVIIEKEQKELYCKKVFMAQTIIHQLLLDGGSNIVLCKSITDDVALTPPYLQSILFR